MPYLRNIPKKWLALLAGAALTAAPDGLQAAALTWKKVAQEVHLPLNEMQAKAEFRFQNHGKQKVTITHVATSCGCTTAALEKKAYDPEEEGVIQAGFDATGREGRQEKVVLVTTDEPGAPTTALRFIVHITPFARIDPPVSVWPQHKAAEPKPVEIEMGDPTVKLEAIEGPSPAFTAELKPGQRPGAYQVILRPLSTEQTVFADIKIKTSSPDRPHIRLYGQVR
jgi:Protein of unknown function (DUF1573)